MSNIDLCVGEVVISGTDWPAIGVKKGDRGIVVDTYEHGLGDWGAQILFRNGGDSGFSKEEIDAFIVRTNLIVPELTTYKFISGVRLYYDWRMKIFDKAWEEIHN